MQTDSILGGGEIGNMSNMSIEEIIKEVTAICKTHNVEHLSLFGSFATGTATSTSDVDFVVYGCKNILDLEDAVDEIMTLRKIDLFDYDNIRNKSLLEDIDTYAKQIY